MYESIKKLNHQHLNIIFPTIQWINVIDILYGDVNILIIALQFQSIQMNVYTVTWFFLLFSPLIRWWCASVWINEMECNGKHHGDHETTNARKRLIATLHTNKHKKINRWNENQPNKDDTQVITSTIFPSSDFYSTFN